MAWFSYAVRKINQINSGNKSRYSFDHPLIWRTNDIPPIHWDDTGNNTIPIAISVYSMGPAYKHLEPGVPDAYYIACGNALITMYSFTKGLHCSLRHQNRYILWNYLCNFYSSVYEYQRTPEVRGMFGAFPIPGFVLACTPYLAFFILLGALNYITMGRVMKKVDAGPTIYHRFEIGCGLVVSMLDLFRDQDCGVIGDWVTFVFTGNYRIGIGIRIKAYLEVLVNQL